MLVNAFACVSLTDARLVVADDVMVLLVSLCCWGVDGCVGGLVAACCWYCINACVVLMVFCCWGCVVAGGHLVWWLVALQCLLLQITIDCHNLIVIRLQLLLLLFV